MSTSKHTTIDALNNHLFDVIEMLKNNKDDGASENEKIDIETAKVVADLGKVVIDGYKVKAQVLGILSKADNPNAVRELSTMMGIGDKKEIAQ